MQDSNIPLHLAPPLTNSELRDCDDLLGLIEQNPGWSVLAMLIMKFRIDTPLAFERRLAGIVAQCEEEDRDHRHDPTHTPRYWFRLATTYSILFLAEMVNPGCVSFEDGLEAAWDHYDTAVKYAKSMGENQTTNLAGLLNKELENCGALLEELIARVSVDETEDGEVQQEGQTAQRRESPRAHIARFQAERFAAQQRG